MSCKEDTLMQMASPVINHLIETPSNSKLERT